MRILFKKENILKTILAVACLVIGILFLVLLGRMVDFVESALCSVLIIVGIVCILIYCILPADNKVYSVMFFGIFATVLGFLILLVPRFFGIALSAIVGAGGIMLITSAVQLKKLGAKSWLINLVIGIVICALAVVSIVLSGTNTAKNILAIFFGINILIQGIYDTVMLVILIKNGKNNIEITDYEVKENEQEQA